MASGRQEGTGHPDLPARPTVRPAKRAYCGSPTAWHYAYLNSSPMDNLGRQALQSDTACYNPY